MGEPLLTYIVPVYNTAALLPRCLQSIIDQPVAADDCEVLVVDDGSTDGSSAVVERFARDYPQVRLLVQQNTGVSAARNLALDNARGQYVAFVDSDDYLGDGAAAILLDRVVADDLDVLVYNFSRVMPDGTDGGGVSRDKYATSPVATGVGYLQQHVMSPYVWRYMVRRELIERLALRFDTSLIACEDGAFIARFMLAAARVAHQDILGYCYVNRGDSAMHNPDADHVKRRIFSQVDAAASINGTINRYESQSGDTAPASVGGLRNVYLYFSMTKALTSGCVDEVLQRIRQAGLYPFPCIGPEANYFGKKWMVIHRLMMHPGLWKTLSGIYRKIKK